MDNNLYTGADNRAGRSRRSPSRGGSTPPVGLSKRASDSPTIMNGMYVTDINQTSGVDDNQIGTERRSEVRLS